MPRSAGAQLIERGAGRATRQMRTRMWLKEIWKMRQIEAGRARHSEARGGRFQEILGGVSDEGGDDELCRDPSSSEWRRSCGQLVEAADRLQSLEGELDLPAQAVEEEDVVDRQAVERGDQDDPLGGFD